MIILLTVIAILVAGVPLTAVVLVIACQPARGARASMADRAPGSWTAPRGNCWGSAPSASPGPGHAAARPAKPGLARG